MKKILGVLLLLAAAGVLFAQEFKWNGYVNSGLGLVATDKNGVDNYLTAYGNDSWQYGYRLRLDGAYTNADANAGANFRIQSQATRDAFISIPYAYGWVKFLGDGVFTLKGGLVDDGTWNSGGAILGATDPDAGEGLGALLRITPVTGLDIGLGAYVVQNGGGDGNNSLARELLGNKIGLDEAKYTFGLAYTIPEILKITSSSRVQNWAAGTTNADDPAPPSQTSRSIFALKLLAVENLNFVVEADFVNLDTYGNTGRLEIYETVGYKVNDFGFGLNAWQFTSRVTNQDKAALLFNPWVSYKIGDIVPQLDLVYVYGGWATLNNATISGTNPAPNTKYYRYAYAARYNTDYSVFTIRPSVKFNFGSAFVEVGDLVNLEKGPAADFGDNDGKQITNVFYVDFKWSF